MKATQLGLYRPGDSIWHRLGTGWKLLGLVVLGVASFWLQRPWWLAVVALATVLACYLVAGFGPRTIWQQWRPMAVILVLTGLLNWWASGQWQSAVVMVATVSALVLAAGLVTLTTRTAELVDVVVRLMRALRGLGVDPERVGLLLALGIRCVPLVAGLAGRVHEAQVARGNTRSWRAFAVPLLVSALRDADAMGEALVARGVDD